MSPARHQQHQAPTGLEHYIAAMLRMEGRLGEMASSVRALTVNAVIDVEKVTIPSSGVWEKSWEVIFSAVRVRNHGTAPVTVTNTGAMSQAPSAGAGIFTVEGLGDVTFNIAGRNLSIYGAAGQTFSIEVYERPVDPAGSGSVSGFARAQQVITPANPAAGAVPANIVVPASGRLIALTFSVNTSATVVTRTLRVSWFRGANRLAAINVEQGFGASFGNVVSLIGSKSYNTNAGGAFSIVQAVPDFPLLEGDALVFDAVNLQAGDTITNLVLTLGSGQ